MVDLVGVRLAGDQAARVDEGVLRMGMAVAMAAIFVVALTIPEAWHDAPGGLDGPLVLVAAALLVDWGGIWLTSRQGGWRVHSAGHWTERHGNFLILAIGESVVAIGTGAAQQPISAPLLLAAVLGVAAAVGLWWLYFDVASLAAEHRLAETQGQARARLALEAYTYGHFPIVAGIVLTALGVEGVLAHADAARPLGGFYAAALLGGAALYLAGELLFKQRMHRTLSLPRLVVVETARYAQARRSLRNP